MAEMSYISTRGQAPALNFEDVLLTGLAPDGGLYVPRELPQFTRAEIAALAGMDYAELAYTLMRPFVVGGGAGGIPAADFKAIVDDCYQVCGTTAHGNEQRGGAGDPAHSIFRHRAVAPLVQLGPNEWVLELFHGPTLAFKDFALQMLGRLLDYVLERRHSKVAILGATSGDTGSAAIEGCRRCRNIDIFILHPHQRISDVQRRQMTTVAGDNIHNIALQGSFDDCQAVVKACFAERDFLPPLAGGEQRGLVAVNSINWARIMAQVVYYFYAALALGAPGRPVAFSVPTGNFGDIFAGYLAQRMGLGVERLIIATNSNDVLHRTLSSGVCHRAELRHTLSPSMDITVSSNFERLLFDLYDRDGAAVADLMARMRSGGIESGGGGGSSGGGGKGGKRGGQGEGEGELALSPTALARARDLFDSARVDDAATCETIAAVWEASGYLLDPHSAVGVRAGRECHRDPAVPLVTLATAHPAKFPEAIRRAGVDVEPRLPRHLGDLMQREERCAVLPNDLAAVQQFMAANLNG